MKRLPVYSTAATSEKDTGNPTTTEPSVSIPEQNPSTPSLEVEQ